MAPVFPTRRFYEQAAKEDVARSFAFLGVNDVICGVEVKSLTPRIVERLKCKKNPYIVGGQISDAHVLQFLWYVSVDFTPETADYYKWEAKYGAIDFTEAHEKISAFIDKTYLDAIGGTNGPSFVSDTAFLCYEMAREPYRIPFDATPDIPLAQIFQLIKARNLAECAPNSKVNKWSGKVMSDWLKEKNEALKKQQSKPKPEKKHGGRHRKNRD